MEVPHSQWQRPYVLVGNRLLSDFLGMFPPLYLRILRKGEGKRKQEQVHKRVEGEYLQELMPAECKGVLRACRYRVPPYTVSAVHVHTTTI